MNWNTYVFKTSITLSTGNSRWDPHLQKTVKTRNWRRVDEDHIDVVHAPDIYSAEQLARIRTILYGMQNGWEGVCIWRVIAEPIDSKDSIGAFLEKWKDS
jgi:hypothetical protein